MHYDISKCRICFHELHILHGQIFDDRYGCPGVYSLLRCRQCGLIETWPHLSNEDLPDLYTTYYPRHDIDIEALPRQLAAPNTIIGRLKIWLSGTGNQGHYYARPGMKVLDYGCGAGTSLLELQRLGVEAYGIEVDANAKRVADHFGLNIHIGSMDDNPFPDKKFDLISLNQVIEHIPDPSTLLAGLAQRLGDKGVIALSFPNVGSLYRRLFGRRWINWHVPYHIHHFNRQSFTELCNNYGWRIIQWETVTPTVWTILQLQALFTHNYIGRPNPIWRIADLSDGRQTLRVSHQIIRMMVRGAMLVLRFLATIIITIVNRLIDAFGLGDSLVVLIEPSSRSNK